MNPHVDRIFGDAFVEYRAVCEETERRCAEAFKRLTIICSGGLASGNKIMFFGNGGSAADAQHLATELTIRYTVDRPALAAMALTVDSSTLTAAANDLGFEEVFARQIEALARAGDVALGISTSGNSENIIRALKKARSTGVHALMLPLPYMVFLHLWRDTKRVLTDSGGLQEETTAWAYRASRCRTILNALSQWRRVAIRSSALFLPQFWPLPIAH